MNRPEGISESAWEIAKQITSAEYDSYAHQVIETAAAIQSAVEAEREATLDAANAYMAEQYGNSALGNPIDRARVIAAIRKGA